MRRSFNPRPGSRGMCTPATLTLSEHVQRIASVALVSTPGTEWRYFVATDVPGLVLETVTHTSLPQAFDDVGLQLRRGIQPERQMAAARNIVRAQRIVILHEHRNLELLAGMHSQGDGVSGLDVAGAARMVLAAIASQSGNCRTWSMLA
jgi:hypothetical protein